MQLTRAIGAPWSWGWKVGGGIQASSWNVKSKGFPAGKYSRTDQVELRRHVLGEKCLSRSGQRRSYWRRGGKAQCDRPWWKWWLRRLSWWQMAVFGASQAPRRFFSVDEVQSFYTNANNIDYLSASFPSLFVKRPSSILVLLQLLKSHLFWAASFSHITGKEEVTFLKEVCGSWLVPVYENRMLHFQKFCKLVVQYSHY